MIQEKEESLKQLKESQARAQEELRTLENEKTTLEAQGSGFKATIEEMMESELVCAICSELFVQVGIIGAEWPVTRKQFFLDLYGKLLRFVGMQQVK